MRQKSPGLKLRIESESGGTVLSGLQFLPDEPYGPLATPATEPVVPRPKTVKLEAAGTIYRLSNEFLYIEIDTARPRVIALRLPSTDGQSFCSNLLKGAGKDFCNGFCKYKDAAGKWHFSFESPPSRVTVEAHRDTEARLCVRGIAFGSALQDWTFSLRQGDATLHFDISTRWIADTAVSEAYFPCFFFDSWPQRRHETTTVFSLWRREGDGQSLRRRFKSGINSGLSFSGVKSPGPVGDLQVVPKSAPTQRL